ncbi:MAG TPA: hypothetical protein PKC10_04935 [Cyclobacteriaceae bacterium]|nr:hypothetical protein [Cyclobacteriaceae bacterium]
MDGKKHTKRGNEVKLTPTLRAELVRFIEYHPADRVSKNLRMMLLEFLQHEGAIEADYLKKLLYDLEGLFELLDAIEVEGIKPNS